MHACFAPPDPRHALALALWAVLITRRLLALFLQLEKLQELTKQVGELRDELDVVKAENATLRKTETANVQLKM